MSEFADNNERSSRNGCVLQSRAIDTTDKCVEGTSHWGQRQGIAKGVHLGHFISKLGSNPHFSPRWAVVACRDNRLANDARVRRI